ncbi:MAG TPA: hypothetical protein VNA28_10670 [Solirubrobacteraceae bacterium]|nr:hypothetical protein [Solirubrobacteraceae bacterium]
MDARTPLIFLLVCAATLGACGGGDTDDAAERANATPQQEERQPQPTIPGGSLDLPAKVPLDATGAGDPKAIKVIRLWSEALRRSDVDGASALWAVPSKVQNGTPLLALATATDVRLFNDSLSCGSQLVSALGGRNGFTVAVFKLTDRPGADCGTGVGSRARTAILVHGGKIVEWYRLPDDPDVLPPDSPDLPQEPGGPII